MISPLPLLSTSSEYEEVLAKKKARGARLCINQQCAEVHGDRTRLHWSNDHVWCSACIRREVRKDHTVEIPVRAMCKRGHDLYEAGTTSRGYCRQCKALDKEKYEQRLKDRDYRWSDGETCVLYSLARIRRAKDVKQSEIAKAVGRAYQTIGCYESALQPISKDLALRIAAYLEVELSDLLEKSGDIPVERGEPSRELLGLDRILTERGVSNRDFEKLCGIDASQISKYRMGRVRARDYNVTRIVDALGVSEEELIAP